VRRVGDRQRKSKVLQRTQTPHNIHSNPYPAKPRGTIQIRDQHSGYTPGAVLSQLCDDGKWHPVGFTSKGLNAAERNYEVHNKEILSVIQGLKEWRHVLEGTKHMIEILNDHRNLTYFRTISEPELSTGMLVTMAHTV